MRRFSQRNSLVTLNEINITPLLDLAFVLLIIFVITRPIAEQSMHMTLPTVGEVRQHDPITAKDIQTVEINAAGRINLGSKRMRDVSQVEAELVKVFRQNPRMVVNIRADKRAEWDIVCAVLNACQRHNITQVAPQVAPVK